MIEGSVHHLDILADFAGAKCDTLYAQTWNPAWGEFAGDSQALVTMHFENGTRAFYEGAKTNAVGLNGWSQEYFRAESRGRHPDPRPPRGRTPRPRSEQRQTNILESSGAEVPLAERPHWAHAG